MMLIGRIAERIVGEVGIKIGIDHQIRVDGHEQGVAVGRGAGDLSGREPAIGAGLVLDDHRLAHRVTQAIPQRARDQVNRAARRLGKNEADGLGRIGLLGGPPLGRRRDQREQSKARQRSRDPMHWRDTS